MTGITAPLQSILSDYDALLEPRKGSGNSPGASGPAASRPPLSDNVLCLRWDIGDLIGDMVWGVQQAQHLGPRSIEDVPATIRWLLLHSDTLAAHHLADSWAERLERFAARAAAITRPVGPPGQLVGRCPFTSTDESGATVTCGRVLHWPTGATHLTCDACGTHDDMQGWADRLGTSRQRLMTIAETAAYITKHVRAITSRSVYLWVQRGHLQWAGMNEHGEGLIDTIDALRHASLVSQGKTAA